MTKIGLKRCLGMAKGRPRGAKVGPRGSKRCPRWGQEEPKGGQKRASGPILEQIWGEKWLKITRNRCQVGKNQYRGMKKNDDRTVEVTRWHFCMLFLRIFHDFGSIFWADFRDYVSEFWKFLQTLTCEKTIVFILFSNKNQGRSFLGSSWKNTISKPFSIQKLIENAPKIWWIIRCRN